MADPAFPAAMQTLQTLHQELDIADAARSKLDIQLILPRSFARELFPDTFPRGRHGLNQGEVQRRRVNEWFNKVQQFLANAPIACGNTGFNQHLQLPSARVLRNILWRLPAGCRHHPSCPQAGGANPPDNTAPPTCRWKADSYIDWRLF